MLGWYSGNTVSGLDYQCVSKDLNPGKKDETFINREAEALPVGTSG